MIDVQTAAKSSAEYLKSFFPTSDQIRIEEIELSDDKKFWAITLSYILDENPNTFLSSTHKYLKTFKIDTDSGEVLAMKIKKV